MLRYKLTPEGYKSFHGGWIEGLSEDQHVYYYNTVTGESSWHLPEELGGLPEENSQEIAAEMDSVEQYSHYEHPHLQQPTHHFTDMYALHDAAAETEAAAHQYGGQSHDQGYEGYEGYPDPSADPQQQPQGGYYDEQGGYYDEHGEDSRPPLPDPNRVVIRCGVCGMVWVCVCVPGYYYNYQHDGPYGEQAEGGDQDEEAYPALQEYYYEKPRTLPVPVRWEVANYSKKEGIDLQTDLLNAQDRWVDLADFGPTRRPPPLLSCSPCLCLCLCVAGGRTRWWVRSTW